MYAYILYYVHPYVVSASPGAVQRPCSPPTGPWLLARGQVEENGGAAGASVAHGDPFVAAVRWSLIWQELQNIKQLIQQVIKAIQDAKSKDRLVFFWTKINGRNWNKVIDVVFFGTLVVMEVSVLELLRCQVRPCICSFEHGHLDLCPKLLLAAPSCEVLNQWPWAKSASKLISSVTLRDPGATLEIRDWKLQCNRCRRRESTWLSGSGHVALHVNRCMSVHQPSISTHICSTMQNPILLALGVPWLCDPVSCEGPSLGSPSITIDHHRWLSCVDILVHPCSMMSTSQQGLCSL